MSGRIMNEIKYMYINDKHDLKPSLNDKVYLILIDIFWNSDSSEICFQADEFINKLTNSSYFENNVKKIKYTNMLHKKEYVKKLQKWLKELNVYCFEFIELEDKEQIETENYMKFDDWWFQFEVLKKIVDKQYELISNENQIK